MTDEEQKEYKSDSYFSAVLVILLTTLFTVVVGLLINGIWRN